MRDSKNRLIMSVPNQPEIGKRAITHYKVVREFNYVSLIECKLETGRNTSNQSTYETHWTSNF